MKFNELATIEKYIIKYLKDNLDYEYIPPAQFATLREFETEYLIKSHLLEAIKKINKIDDEQAKTILREIKKLDTNEEFLHLMRYGVNLKDPQTQKSRDYLVFDLTDLENNHFVVTNQFYFEGNSENIRTDVLVFVNGLPIVNIEAKSPTASTSVNFENAVGQIKRYERAAPKLFWPNCFNLATDGNNTVYGTTYSPKQYFLTWKDAELEKKLGGKLELSLYALLEKSNLMDIIANFIVFEDDKDLGIKIKKMARYQQLRASNKIVDRIIKDNQRKGLIWHTQGSGKSLTMFFTAWKLRFHCELKNPKVFILVDRIDLDDQIYNTFLNCGGKNIIRVESRIDLEKKITSPVKGIFICTIQKFSELSEHIKSDDKIIILSDEAHRDNEGISAINLRFSMPNAFFFGFTGTPIDKKTLNTHRNFSEEGERYLDYYSIQEAIDDGATLPVSYEARLSKFSLDETRISEQFNELTSDLTDEQKQALIKKYGRKAGLIKLDKRVEAITQDIVEHFKAYVEPNGFKAQVVCYDREATAKYKKFFDKILPPETTRVVYSSGDHNTDLEELQAYNTTKKEREQIITDFKDPEHPLKLLLVCDMLLTGFDAPIEQVMYLDKPLRDHNLLQAIARTNRIYPNKGYGKVIDYYGITNNLFNALDFDEDIIASALINIDKLKEEFEEVLANTLELFVGINIEDPSYGNLRTCLNIFTDNITKQEYFKTKYSRLKMLFEVLSPDPYLKQFIRKFEWLTSVYIAFLKEYQPNESMIALEEYGEKVKKLIQEKIDYDGITRNFKPLNVHDIYFLERLEEMPEEQRAIALEKALEFEISKQIDIDPNFVRFGEKLTQIKDEFEQGQISLQERIKKYYNLKNDIDNKADEAGKLGLNLQEYGLFVILQEYLNDSDQVIIIELSKNVVKQLADLLDKGWQNSAKREELIKTVKRILQELLLKEYKDKINIKDFSKLANRLVDIIIKKF